MTPTERKLRVLQIIKGLDIGALNGGAEQVGLTLAHSLSKTCDVTLCVFFRVRSPLADEWQKKLTDWGIDFFYAADWQGNDRFGVYLAGMSNLRRQLRGRQVEIVNSHFQLGHIAALDLKSRGLARKVVRTVHNIPVREWSRGWYGWLRYQVLTKWAFPILADVEVGVSQAVVDELNRHGGARLFGRRVRLIYNAVPFLPTAGEVIPLAEQPVIGVVGRLAEQKGHRYLIQALPLIRQRIPGLKVWFLGDGALRAELRALAEGLGVGDCVEFLGHREDVASYLRQMKLLVLPSLYEGLPLTVLEGMAVGVPVLATDIPGTRELVRHTETGWLVPPKDPQALAQAITDALCDPPGLERVRQNALRQMERFSIASMTEQYRQIYFQLLGQTRP